MLFACTNLGSVQAEDRGQRIVNSEVGMRNERVEIGMRKAESKAASIEQRTVNSEVGMRKAE